MSKNNANNFNISANNPFLSNESNSFLELQTQNLNFQTQANNNTNKVKLFIKVNELNNKRKFTSESFTKALMDLNNSDINESIPMTGEQIDHYFDKYLQ